MCPTCQDDTGKPTPRAPTPPRALTPWHVSSTPGRHAWQPSASPRLSFVLPCPGRRRKEGRGSQDHPHTSQLCPATPPHLPRYLAAAFDLPIRAATPAVSPRVSTFPETQKRGEGNIKPPSPPCRDPCRPSPPCRDPCGHLPPSCVRERRRTPRICTCTCAGRRAPLRWTSCSQHHCWLPPRFHLDLQLCRHGQQLPLRVLMHPPLHVLMHLPPQSHLDLQLHHHGQHLPFACLAHELSGAHAPAPKPLAVPAWATKVVAGSYPWVSA